MEHAVLNIGMVKRQAQFISLNYENQLWECNVLGEDTPQKLHGTILYLLGLRVGDEHYYLCR